MHILSHKNRFAAAALLGVLFAVLFASFQLPSAALVSFACAGSAALQHAFPSFRSDFTFGLVANRGRMINFISGLNGVTAGGNAVVNFPVNARYHRIVLNTTDSGSAAAVSSIISSMKLLVNGQTIRDITPANTIKICQANGYTPLLGELPILFSEPFPTSGIFNEPSDINSWDLAGQNTFSLQLTLAGGTTPGITGAVEFDDVRNLDEAGNPFLQVINHHAFTIPVPGGQYDITTLPFSYPIRRLWFALSTGTLSEIDVFADGKKWREGLTLQNRELYRQCGFKFAQTDYTPFVNATGPAALGVSTAVEAINYFDGAVIFDVDGRGWKSLQVEKQLIVRVNTSAAANLTVIAETIPGSFTS